VIEESVQRAAAKYNLRPELIKAVIRAESNFQIRAVSHAGAKGLMQLMPPTARELGVTDIFDIEQNIDGGAKYLRRMLDRFDGNVRKALAAYNAGPGTVIRYNGQVPYPETRQYVQRVLRFSEQMA
jgi:soluble lytic murein transglycosylase-like protein